MQDAQYGVAAQHARSRPTHDNPYLLALVRAIAMNQAIGAGWLGVTKDATLQPAASILQQFVTTCTEWRSRLMSVGAAIHAQHGAYGF